MLLLLGGHLAITSSKIFLTTSSQVCSGRNVIFFLSSSQVLLANLSSGTSSFTASQTSFSISFSTAGGIGSSLDCKPEQMPAALQTLSGVTCAWARAHSCSHSESNGVFLQSCSHSWTAFGTTAF